MEGIGGKGGTLLIQKFPLSLPGALCKLELSLRKWSVLRVSEPWGRDTTALTELQVAQAAGSGGGSR